MTPASENAAPSSLAYSASRQAPPRLQQRRRLGSLIDMPHCASLQQQLEGSAPSLAAFLRGQPHQLQTCRTASSDERPLLCLNTHLIKNTLANARCKASGIVPGTEWALSMTSRRQRWCSAATSTCHPGVSIPRWARCGLELVGLWAPLVFARRAAAARARRCGGSACLAAAHGRRAMWTYVLVCGGRSIISIPWLPARKRLRHRTQTYEYPLNSGARFLPDLQSSQTQFPRDCATPTVVQGTSSLASLPFVTSGEPTEPGRPGQCRDHICKDLRPHALHHLLTSDNAGDTQSGLALGCLALVADLEWAPSQEAEKSTAAVKATTSRRSFCPNGRGDPTTNASSESGSARPPLPAGSRAEAPV